MQPNKPYLVIANSGRALAASAFNAGIKTHVIDCFADIDTKDYSLSARAVKGDNGEISSRNLHSILDEFSDKPIEGVVVGSGLENQTEILEEINYRFILFGNSAECVNQCKEPSCFFPLLDALNIPCPETSKQAPDEPDGWLIKKTGATGGKHINWADSKTSPGNCYYQKFVDGDSISVTFLADKKHACILGINQTWTHNKSNNDFSYAGAMTFPDIKPTVAADLANIVNTLVAHLQLRGLCGLDAIVDQHGKCYVLEINPRPVATFELYENKQGIFDAHIKACQGILEKPSIRSDIYRAHEIIYLTQDLVVPPVLWPEWISDRPNEGTLIASGEPVCTIHAVAKTPCKIKEVLARRRKNLDKLLGLEKIAA